MIEKIEIKNYRGIEEISIDNFKKYNIFVGDNSSCKTSVMEAIYSSLPNVRDGIITTANSRGMQVRLDNIHNFFYNADIKKEIQFILDDKIITKINRKENNNVENEKIIKNIENNTISKNLMNMNVLNANMKYLYDILQKDKNNDKEHMDISVMIDNFIQILFQERINIKSGNYYGKSSWITPLSKYQNDTAKVVKKIIEKNINISEYKNADDVSFVLVKNIRKKLGIIASNYYGYPQNKIKIIGITGTNGKTTSSFILENILEKTARIGTTGNRILDEEFETVNTTPESLELIKLIDKSVKKGADYFIMEVSSHALEIGRVDMLKFDSAIFTNLTQDHLDFHKTMENYFNAKKKIFSMLRNDKNNGKGIINIDDEHGAKIYSEKNKDNYISISIKNEEADILGDILNYTNNGMKVKINLKNYFKKINSHFKDKDEEYEEEYKFEIGLIGEYNLYNVLGCVASALSFGIKMNDIIKKLETMPAVPGRFETIKNNMEARIVVDFAHTDDGLLNVGKTLKQITDNQVITIFGAGGDRDHDKRAKMAKAAIQFSDYIILTSDNPRTENPINILADIEKGLIDEKYPFDKYLIISDRERAIKHGIKLLKKGDSLLIAGKGHENYQIIGTQKIHFDDRETVRKILEEENNI